jgi:hypothetical protein
MRNADMDMQIETVASRARMAQERLSDMMTGDERLARFEAWQREQSARMIEEMGKSFFRRDA